VTVGSLASASHRTRKQFTTSDEWIYGGKDGWKDGLAPNEDCRPVWHAWMTYDVICLYIIIYIYIYIFGCRDLPTRNANARVEPPSPRGITISASLFGMMSESFISNLVSSTLAKTQHYCTTELLFRLACRIEGTSPRHSIVGNTGYSDIDVSTAIT